jgi:hypothetical protein
MDEYYSDAQFEINRTEEVFGGEMTATDHAILAVAKAILALSQDLSAIRHEGIIIKDS